MSGWLPFRSQIADVLLDCRSQGINDKHGRQNAVHQYIRTLLSLPPLDVNSEETTEKGENKVLLCHGEADQKVRYEWGNQMSDVFLALGLETEFKSYPGLEHWYSEEELTDIVLFLQTAWVDDDDWRPTRLILLSENER